jgi:hypothetical protein
VLPVGMGSVGCIETPDMEEDTSEGKAAAVLVVVVVVVVVMVVALIPMAAEGSRMTPRNNPQRDCTPRQRERAGEEEGGGGNAKRSTKTRE